jgi:Glycosyltransferase
LRQLFLTIGAFFKVWSLTRNHRVDAVVCDVLNASLCSATIKACQITHTQTIGVMTDMPGLMVRFGNGQKMPFRTKIATKLIKRELENFNKYVFLTEAMNVVNTNHRPYIVMEGMSDSDMASCVKDSNPKAVRVIMYAGGLHERYGLKKLTEAFMMQKKENLRLKIFGNGPFVDDLKGKYCMEDSRIQYMGVVPNAEIVQAELDATLLVNPRPTNEVFTKYSFPSKNIEYMTSGTPLLTTKLPGMPAEYYPYVYLIEEESTEGYARAMYDALTHTDDELYAYGEHAKRFVLNKKNSYEQTKRVAQLINYEDTNNRPR